MDTFALFPVLFVFDFSLLLEHKISRFYSIGWRQGWNPVDRLKEPPILTGVDFRDQWLLYFIYFFALCGPSAVNWLEPLIDWLPCDIMRDFCQMPYWSQCIMSRVLPIYLLDNCFQKTEGKKEREEKEVPLAQLILGEKALLHVVTVLSKCSHIYI